MLLQVDTLNVVEQIASATVPDGVDKLSFVFDKLVSFGISAGGHILTAIVVFLVGKLIVNALNRLVARILEKRHVDTSVKTFLKSLTNILLTIILIISVIGALGINTTSFAALLASAGVAIGMALSGNLQNFAGGLIILLFKPYKVGDLIESQGVIGVVSEIQILHTIITTADNKVIYIPNGSLSSGVVINYSNKDTRRVEWTVGVEYGEDYTKVEQTVRDILAADSRVLKTPEPFIVLSALDASSVNVMIRVWVKSSDYWDVYFGINKKIYAVFNEKGIGFPFLKQKIDLLFKYMDKSRTIYGFYFL